MTPDEQRKFRNANKRRRYKGAKHEDEPAAAQKEEWTSDDWWWGGGRGETEQRDGAWPGPDHWEGRGDTWGQEWPQDEDPEDYETNWQGWPPASGRKDPDEPPGLARQIPEPDLPPGLTPIDIGGHKGGNATTDATGKGKGKSGDGKIGNEKGVGTAGASGGAGNAGWAAGTVAGGKVGKAAAGGAGKVDGEDAEAAGGAGKVDSSTAADNGKGKGKGDKGAAPKGKGDKGAAPKEKGDKGKKGKGDKGKKGAKTGKGKGLIPLMWEEPPPQPPPPKEDERPDTELPTPNAAPVTFQLPKVSPPREGEDEWAGEDSEPGWFGKGNGRSAAELKALPRAPAAAEEQEAEEATAEEKTEEGDTEVGADQVAEGKGDSGKATGDEQKDHARKRNCTYASEQYNQFVREVQNAT